MSANLHAGMKPQLANGKPQVVLVALHVVWAKDEEPVYLLISFCLDDAAKVRRVHNVGTQHVPLSSECCTAENFR